MGSDASEDPVARLSDRQRQCLGLIARGSSPKEVASAFDLSVETVHAHLKAARRTLGVGSSRQAALMMTRSMGNHEMVMAGSIAQSQHRSNEMASGPGRIDEGGLRDIHPVGTVQPGAVRRSDAGRLDHLTPLRRVLLLVLAVVGTVVAVAGLLATAHGLQQMLWSIYQVH